MIQTTPNVKIIPAVVKPIEKTNKYKQLRVAAYCRVSTEQEEQQNSYNVQIAYYTDLINRKKEWTLAGIFADVNYCQRNEKINNKKVKQGDSGVNDFIRNDLQRYHPKIRIEDTPQFYDLSVFNRCAETGKVLLTIECWQEVHPGLVSIPVNWDYSIPYGLLYSFDAPKDVLRFVERVKALRNE